MAKRIALLGSTGSIGQQTLEVVAEHPESFEIVALAARSGGESFTSQVSRIKPAHICLSEESAITALKASLANLCPGYTPEFHPGPAGLIEIVTDREVDLVVVATSGQHGFAPTLAALKSGKEVALANKEVLVMAGELVTGAARAAGAQIRPIDSEHSAIWQCLRGEGETLAGGEENWAGENPQVRRLILTASGGPFRTFSRAEMEHVTVEQAMKHPNWNMGPKITIDSATLFNKGLEVIEAHWLFGLPYEKIDVVVHPESIIHSMIEFVDSSIKAQLGTPNMRVPIQYALGYPERLSTSFPRLDFTRLKELHFEIPDLERFPALGLAYEAGKRGGTYPTVLAAADEEAVRFFHERRLSYLGISGLVQEVLARHTVINQPNLEDIAGTDAWARRISGEIVDREIALKT